jgi:hypothetical protein
MSRRSSRPVLAAGAVLSTLGLMSVAGPSPATVASPTSAGVRGLGLGPASLSSLAGHLNPRSQALATVAEKIGGSGAESSRGPAQEAYDNRAFPAAGIATAQVTAARAAYSKHGKNALAFTQVGPDKQSVPAAVTYTGVASTVAGRTAALLPLAGCSASSCTVLAGTAGGGIWRTSDALGKTPSWTSVGTGLTSGAIGSLAQAGNRVYAGTGEPNGSGDSEAGTGLFVSTDQGTSFTRVPTALPGGTDLAIGRSVASIVVDRSDSRHLLVGTAVARHGSSSVNGGRYTPPGSAKVGLY